MKWKHTLIVISIVSILGCSTFINVTTSGYKNTGQSQNLFDPHEIVSTQINHALIGFFYENVGQATPSDILFIGRTAGEIIAFSENRISIISSEDSSHFSFTFETNRHIKPKGENESEHKTNFIKGNDLRFTGIRGFTKLNFEEVWPGISVICTATISGVVLQFLISQEADVSRIQISTSSVDLLKITDKSILLQDDQTEIILDDIEGFQAQSLLSANFVELEESVFGISLDAGQPSHPIIIQSILHSVLIGGSDFDIPFSLSLDSYSNAFVTGYTLSSVFSLGSTPDTTFDGDSDCFVFKIDLSDNSIIYSTFIGGSDNDIGTAISVDSVGNAYVTGRTQSRNFPVHLPFDDSFNGGVYDSFVLKLNSDGDNLVYSTLLGGSKNDYAESLAIDSSGQVYVAGYTCSSDFPTINGYNLNFRGGFSDTFVVKLDKNGENLNYSTFMGGSQTDSAVSIALDNEGCAFVAGYTYSNDFPIVNAIDYTYNGFRDSIVYKLSSNGSQLVYSTFLGGSWIDQAESISVDTSGSAFVLGTTYSEDFPLLNALYEFQNGGSDCYISAISPSGNHLLFSTYFGGSGNDFGESLFIDSNGYVYVSGETESPDFPIVTTNPSVTNETSGTFITKFNASYNSILYSTFIGDYPDKSICSMAVDSYGNAFIAGYRTLNASRVNILGSFITSSTDVFVLRVADFSDSDSDGLADYVENDFGLDRFSADSDQDGLADFRELNFLNTNPLSNDTDSDNLSDWQEVEVFHTNPLLGDSDFDNLGDALEVLILGTNPNVVDTDEDTLDDNEEVNIYGTNPLTPDSDLDMISDANEILVYGTNPLSNDSDSDEMPDSWEILNGLNPVSNDSMGDIDSDSLSNIDEYLLGTNPCSNDTDSDGINDALEVRVYGTNPLQLDSDDDFLSDYDEVFIYNTNATNEDTDYDLMPDNWEINHGLNALGNDSAGDVDLDGLSNLLEYLYGANPNLNDTDSDALDDLAEVVVYGTQPNNNDSDFDNLSDYSEIMVYSTNPLNQDSDSDNLNDNQEIQIYFTNPLNNDTDLDLMLDGWETLYSLNPLVNDSLGDEDFDLLSNLDEYLNGTNPQNNDTDSDNLSDFEELAVYNTDPTNPDSDYDDVSDSDEISIYLTDPNDDDSDDDLMLDGWEVQYGLDPTTNDSLDDFDSDGLSNLQEFLNDANPLLNDTDLDGLLDSYEVFTLGTLPGSNDSDSDIMTDDWEISYGLNPLYDDATGDLDHDKLSNVLEYLNNSDPTNPHSDSDGLDDYEEVILFNSKPDTPDSDQDTLTDFDEVKIFGTNPNLSDTDSDQIPDPWEIQYNLNPLLYNSADDDDSDGLNNLEEYENKTNPHMNDTDKDQLSDYVEVNNYLTNPLESDSDGDELDDYAEIVTYNTNPLSNDTDSDSLPDAWEVAVGLDALRADSSEDPDSDGLTNLNEYQFGSHPLLIDSDSDELTDVEEINTYGTDPSDEDTDNDNLSDADEVLRYGTDANDPDTDADKIRDGWEISIYHTNPLIADTDSDSMIDGWEVTYGLNPLQDDGNEDKDHDGLVNKDEYALETNPIDSDSDNDELNDYSEYVTYGTSPTDADTDDDLAPDGWEIRYGFNPLVDDSFTDSDLDGLIEIEEYYYGSSPLSSDSDSDGLGDFEEAIEYHTNPTAADSDFDGLSDFDEVMFTGTSPLSKDTDDDGMPDLWEVTHNLNATMNNADLDPDLDELTNLMEYLHETDPWAYDTDEDLLSDFIELNKLGTNPLQNDTDLDTLIDSYEFYISNTNPLSPDSDSDGLSDSVEIAIGTNPNSSDSDMDNIPDAWEFSNGFDPNDSFVPIQEILYYHAIWFLVMAAVVLFGVAIYAKLMKSRK